MNKKILLTALMTIIVLPMQAKELEKNTKSKDLLSPQIECQPYPACMDNQFISDGIDTIFDFFSPTISSDKRVKRAETTSYQNMERNNLKQR